MPLAEDIKIKSKSPDKLNSSAIKEESSDKIISELLDLLHTKVSSSPVFRDEVSNLNINKKTTHKIRKKKKHKTKFSKHDKKYTDTAKKKKKKKKSKDRSDNTATKKKKHKNNDTIEKKTSSTSGEDQVPREVKINGSSCSILDSNGKSADSVENSDCFDSDNNTENAGCYQKERLKENCSEFKDRSRSRSFSKSESHSCYFQSETNSQLVSPKYSSKNSPSKTHRPPDIDKFANCGKFKISHDGEIMSAFKSQSRSKSRHKSSSSRSPSKSRHKSNRRRGSCQKLKRSRSRSNSYLSKECSSKSIYGSCDRDSIASENLHVLSDACTSASAISNGNNSDISCQSTNTGHSRNKSRSRCKSITSYRSRSRSRRKSSHQSQKRDESEKAHKSKTRRQSKTKYEAKSDSLCRSPCRSERQQQSKITNPSESHSHAKTIRRSISQQRCKSPSRPKDDRHQSGMRHKSENRNEPGRLHRSKSPRHAKSSHRFKSRHKSRSSRRSRSRQRSKSSTRSESYRHSTSPHRSKSRNRSKSSEQRKSRRRFGIHHRSKSCHRSRSCSASSSRSKAVSHSKNLHRSKSGSFSRTSRRSRSRHRSKSSRRSQSPHQSRISHRSRSRYLSRTSHRSRSRCQSRARDRSRRRHRAGDRLKEQRRSKISRSPRSPHRRSSKSSHRSRIPYKSETRRLSGSRSRFKSRLSSRSPELSNYKRKYSQRSRSRSSGKLDRSKRIPRSESRSYSRRRSADRNLTGRESKGRYRDHYSDRNPKRSSRSASKSRRKSRDRSNSPPKKKKVENQIDKQKLLEIARKNAINMFEQGTLPASLSFIPKQSVTQFKAGGKTVDELTDFCKQLSKDEQDGLEVKVPNEKKNSSDEEESFHHPFQTQDKSLIVMNIRNSVQLPVKTAKEVTTELSKQLRLQFPVSSGEQHRSIVQSEWVDVDTDFMVASEVTRPVESSVKSEAPAFDAKEFDLSNVMAERLSAVKQLSDNPSDQFASYKIQKIDHQIKLWAESKQEFGIFTGSTGAKILSAAELSAGPQAWAMKYQLKSATPVSGGFGMKLLQKLGWKPGEGLGKYKQGPAVPYEIDIKVDKRGLMSNSDVSTPILPNSIKPSSVKIITMPPSQNTDENSNFTVGSLQSKHPVSILNEYCSRKKIGAPVYTFDEITCKGKRMYHVTVTIQGSSYKTTVANSNKKQAKYDAAMLCLSGCGILPTV